ncbi:MAG: D-alanyl-D-alanine carboxypeptidase family protein [Candidatus Gracilibacteria bacterium]|jgi:LAS superfamily LD-carboxypeptidase LdcB
MKKILNPKILLPVILLLAVCVSFYYWVFVRIDYVYLNAPQRYLATSVFQKWDVKVALLEEAEQNKLSLQELEQVLNPFEEIFVNRILSIPGAELGFKGKYFGVEMPEDLILIPNKVFDVKNGKEDKYETGSQYYPQAAYADFEKMNAAMQQATGKRVWLDSGYRSPGKQAYLFFKYLTDTEEGNNFSLLENAKWIALPGYSEHGSSATPALDYAIEGGDSVFEKADGSNMDSEESQAFFERTAEYKWLQAEAAKYNFFLSYPSDNPEGVSFEPWHWHWEKK